jgi:hypothetical protein
MTYITVDVDLSDFNTEDLVEELEFRGKTVNYDPNALITAIYEKRRLGQDYQTELDNLIYETTGRFL